MNVALFGATGGTGRELVKKLLHEGHHVTALARTPKKLADLADHNLLVMQGDVLEQQDVLKTVDNTSAVIVSLGTTDNNPDNVVSEGTRLIIEAMDIVNTDRLIVVTSLGVGDSKDQVPFAFKLIMKTVLRKVMADKNVQEQYVRDSGLEWTIVRPGGLTDGPATGQYKISTGSDITAGQVSRADVADFIVQELETSNFVHLAVAIT